MRARGGGDLAETLGVQGVKREPVFRPFMHSVINAVRSAGHTPPGSAADLDNYIWSRNDVWKDRSQRKAR